MDVFWILLRATTDCRSNGALSSSLSDHNPPPQQTLETKNTVTMIPHDPPAPSGSNWIGKCDHRTSCNRSRWFRCGDVFYIDKTNLFFILLTIVLFASAHRSRGQKVSFLCYFIVLLLFRWFDATRIDPSYPPILFFPRPPQYSSCFSLILDRGGRMRHVPVTDKRAGTNDRALSSVCWERVCK